MKTYNEILTEATAEFMQEAKKKVAKKGPVEKMVSGAKRVSRRFMKKAGEASDAVTKPIVKNYKKAEKAVSQTASAVKAAAEKKARQAKKVLSATGKKVGAAADATVKHVKKHKVAYGVGAGVGAGAVGIGAAGYALYKVKQAKCKKGCEEMSGDAKAKCLENC